MAAWARRRLRGGLAGWTHDERGASLGLECFVAYPGKPAVSPVGAPGIDQAKRLQSFIVTDRSDGVEVLGLRPGGPAIDLASTQSLEIVTHTPAQDYRMALRQLGLDLIEIIRINREPALDTEIVRAALLLR